MSARHVIVDALDDLGERDKLSYDQRNRSEMAYPPSVVDERLQNLRRGRWGYRLAFGFIVGIIVAVGLGYQFDWAITEYAVGLLMMLLPTGGITIRRLVYESKAEQLYDLLRELEGGSVRETADRGPELETA